MIAVPDRIVTGRFAPSPTGELHLGSVMAAVASYLNVRTVGGRWLVRIDDLDEARVLTGSADRILRALEVLGFVWDGVIWQSERLDHYARALGVLQQQGMIYACRCSRAEIHQRMGRSGVYDNACRERHLSAQQTGYAWRLCVPEGSSSQVDAIQDHYVFDWSTLGDMVVRRADGVIAYHLACAIDDADPDLGITEVVRGSDLLSSTPPQVYIQQRLGLASPHYAHYPILLSAQGIKYSKASQAPAVDTAHPVRVIHQVLALLGQSPPSILLEADLSTLWQWAMTHWQVGCIPKRDAFSLGEENEDVRSLNTIAANA